MNLSSKTAVAVGGLTLAAGITAAIATPFVIAGLGAYALGTWAAAQGMGTFGAIALGGIGLFGGGIVGSVAGKLIALGAVAAAAATGAATKGFGMAVGKLFGLGKEVTTGTANALSNVPHITIAKPAFFNKGAAKASFDAAAQPANDNATVAAAPKRQFKIAGRSFGL